MPTSACRSRALCALAVLASLSRLAGAERLVCDFEDEGQRALFEMKTGALSDQHATHGAHSLKIAPGEYLTSWRMPQDWSGNDSLDLDVFVDGDQPVSGSILVGDQAWKDKGSTYWNRHNGGFHLSPGANVLSIPVEGLYRGEAGSRGNDLHDNIDPKRILRLDLGFAANDRVKAIYLDNLRLVKGSRPDGVLAFDFGPESQTLAPGFTGISWNTVHGANGAKAGFAKPCGAPNRARDDTFPTRLYQDFVWFEENGNEFVVDLPNGRYRAWLVFDDCGYWGGETTHHRKRVITANGVEAVVDDRGDAGPTDYLFRFEDIEPHPGDSLWDLYVKDLFKPARFAAVVSDGALRIGCRSDAPWSAKVAALVIYPEAEAAEAERWLGEVEAANRHEFEQRATCMGPRAKPLTVPPEAQAQGWWFGYPGIDDTVTFVDAPGAAGKGIERTAARGQQLWSTFAVRPLKDFPGPVALTATDLTGPAGTIPAASIDLRYVHHLAQRGFGDIAYTIQPMSLRHLKACPALAKDLTRQFFVAARVPDDAKPGRYAGMVTLTAGKLRQQVPLAIEVIDAALDDPEFNSGMLGAWVPAELPEARRKGGMLELLTLLKRNGLNAVNGGPNIPFAGFDAAGKPQLDFAACDEFFALLAKAGFTHPVYSYGAPAQVEGLSDGYTIGATGQALAEKLGKPYPEVLRTVWTAVEAHAKEKGWPTRYYALLDEPRALEPAQENLAWHRAWRDGAPMVKVGGYYSVDWRNEEPFNATMQEIFKTMSWSGLNEHHQVDLDRGKEFGREIHIYNQGLDRFSWGAYQWAEMRKGVKGRMEWYVLALQGYQFFDLDAREPDPGVINWGRDEIIPTLHLARVCEGVNDFRLAVTLWNRAAGESAKAKAARAWLEDISNRIPAGARERGAQTPDEDAFRSGCIERLKSLIGGG